VAVLPRLAGCLCTGTGLHGPQSVAVRTGFRGEDWIQGGAG
jgi:hypothetical protein